MTLIVSRQQVLPYKDPEVAAALEDEFLRRGVKLLKGARAIGDRPRRRQGRSSTATTAAAVEGSHAVFAIGFDPEQRRTRLRVRRCGSRRARLRPRQPPLPDERAAHLLRRRLVGPAPALVGCRDAGPQDRRARDGTHRARPSSSRLRQGRVRRSSPTPRSPTSASPKPRRSRSVASCASPRSRSRRTRSRSSTATHAAS